MRFVVPLRAGTGWTEAFDRDVGDLAALVDLDHVAQREQHLPPPQRTRWRVLLRDYPVTDPDSGASHDLRVAYIWSSEEARSVADARERALTKAEDSLTRVRNGLGGRYYKTPKDVDAKVARIVVFGLIEADLRRQLPHDDPRLPGLLPEGRAAKPTGRNALAAFQGLGLTYTAAGLLLDPLTPTQRIILALLDIPLPGPERQD